MHRPADVTSARSRSRLAWRAGVGMVVLGLATGCGSRRPPPAPGESLGVVPDLTGRRVMVLPVQTVEGLPGDVDAELAFALQSRAAEVDWVMPAELREAVATSPSLDVRLEGLPVAVFLRTEVERVGDPLFGVLRRLGALTGGEVALIPVIARYRPGSGASPGAVEVAAALLDVRSGYVLWYGVEEGEPGSVTEPAVLASTLDVLARRFGAR